MEPVTRARLQAIYQTALEADAGVELAHIAPERLQALVERSGAEADRLQALDHVMSCRACREGFDMLLALQEAHETADVGVATATRTDVAAPDAMRWAPRRWVPMLLAASLVLAVGLSTLRDRAPADTGEEVMRGSANLPTAVHPRGIVSPDSSRAFVWRAVDGALRYDVELLSSDGTSLHTASTRDTTYQLPLSLNVPAGSYQWFVSAELPNGQRATGVAERFTVR